MSAPPPSAAALPRLRLRGITKAYPTLVANADIDLAVMPGEIHAILGENGAGKSTLMKIIYGLVEPDAGLICWNEQPVELANPAAARKLGIGMVFQHFSLFETLTVAENIALAMDVEHAGPDLPARIRAVSGRYGLPLEPERHVHTMSVGERQRVEIVRCLLQAPQLLILDEPTSVLTPQAVERLFDTLRHLAQEGCSILYISHKLDEIRSLCHRATVLRAGRVTGSCDPRQASASTLARMMIGTDLPHPHRRVAHPAPVPALEVRGLSQPGADPFGTALVAIDFAVHGGEVLGIAGVSGNGQSELLAALSGEVRCGAEAVHLLGEPVGHLDANARRARGLAVVPEERLGRGAVPEMTLAENTLLTSWRHGVVRRGFIDFATLHALARRIIERYQVVAPGPEAAAESLSGGNLQKFIVGRELSQNPRVLVVAQPTWGVDVGASALIRQALLDLRDAGVAVLVISEELDELLEISDRIAVMARGRLSASVPAGATSAAALGLLMSGATTDADDTADTGAEAPGA